jgi:hypothetical protein
MDFEAGLPILVDSLIAVVLLSWLSSEVQWMESTLLLYMRRQVPAVTERLKRINELARTVAILSTLVAPTIMAFSGQLDAHGVAHIYNDALQIIAPTTSAFFSAAVAWLLIISLLAVYRSHVHWLDLLPGSRGRREFW